ncbi:PREDICTED: uncharacterized protein C16orf86 homolog isoform X1 [Colobus angolensis palliatus]|uniref:uncharacterized protein C16orf86 homolog isoform X1 n=1 Tax=Colobus angolensis palliatus TaxID=336983 RepID=UPI0005F57C75|nr:PREDICTED: uncharacterized protein C16orf86 homolog isoform X1 [Colobus angolensis palliatus]
MASAGAERRPGVQEATVVGQGQLAEDPGSAQTSECPVAGEHFLVPAHEARGTQGEDQRPAGAASELELQEEGPKLEGERPKLEAGALEERGPRPVVSIVRPRHGPKRKPVKSFSLPGLHAHPKAEAELPPRLPLQEEEPEGSQSEPSPSAKQHKKAKKRKSLGAPVLHAVASTVSAPLETLGLEPSALPWVFAGKAQRLRPLYQYINYCNPELNQAGEGDGEAEVEAEAELALVPEEAGVEQLQALLPLAGELGPGLALPCPNPLVTPIHALAPLGEEAGGLPSLGVSDHHKAEVDKSTQVDIDKMLSVCTAPLVPPLSPQYK